MEYSELIFLVGTYSGNKLDVGRLKLDVGRLKLDVGRSKFILL